MIVKGVRVPFCVAVALAGGCREGSAADPLPAAPVSAPGWILTVTGNVRVGPRYPGSQDFSFLGFPSFGLRRVGEPKRFSTPDDGLSVPLYDTAALRVGIAGRFRGGRYFGDDRRLFGFEDVKWAVEPGLFVEFWPSEMLRLRTEVRYGVNGYNGFVGDVGVDGVLRYGQFTFAAGPRLSWGDQEFTSTYFGVTPLESAINGLVPPYRPSGGVTSAGLATSLSYDFSEQWSTTVSASFARLVGDAADSPIVERFGSENQFSVGASVSYSFSTGW
jgi:outer membrane scaffolding protein for murein synthesis (MipA/OmpV family)